MKKNIYRFVSTLLLVISATLFVSCEDYLDVDHYFYDQLSLDSAFTKRLYVDGWLANVYEHIDRDCGEMENDFKYFSDDLFKRHDFIRALQNCTYSAQDQTNQDKLQRLYECVRKASTFMLNVDMCREMTLSEIEDYRAQARFARAYAYWALIRQYGPVPLVPNEGLDVSMSYEELSLPRTHFDEIVDFLDEELKLAAVNLQVLPRTVNNLGRPTRGAALGLRARILLYAASPLFNGNKELFNVKNLDGTQLVAQEYDETKWARAAAAAKDVIELGMYELHIIAPDKELTDAQRPPFHPVHSNADFPDGWANVDPYLSYKAMFDGTIQGSKNPELIFTRTTKSSAMNELVNLSLPKTLKGANQLFVSQKMVDAYYMNDGRTILDAEETGDYKRVGFTTSRQTLSDGFTIGENVSLMYVDREPRFYASIGFNGSIWECESAQEAGFRGQQIFYYRGLNDGKQGFKDECPWTGYTLRKFYNKEDAWTDGGYRTQKTENTIRYGEILMIYAEALNELAEGKVYELETYNQQPVEIQYDPVEMQWAMKQIRSRAGLPDFTNDIYYNKEQFRQKLKRERQIELFAENAMRFFDVRRWKDADVEENQAIRGCNIDISDEETKIQKFYEPVDITSMPKVFFTKMYLWPFPVNELRNNVNMTQNPGW